MAMKSARYHVEMQRNDREWSEDALPAPIHADSVAEARDRVRDLRLAEFAYSDETFRIVYYPAFVSTPHLREVVAILLPGDHGREPAASTLQRLMQEAGMEGAALDSTTVQELALRLQGARDGVQVRCPHCAQGYSWVGFAYLEPTGFWTEDGTRGRHPELNHAGPVFEGRFCKACNSEFRVPAGPRAGSKPLYKNEF
jgi:hypothetical protein